MYIIYISGGGPPGPKNARADFLSQSSPDRDPLSDHTLVQWVSPGAWPQVARVCREFPDDEGIDATDWPSHSSDLNPAEKLWHKY